MTMQPYEKIISEAAAAAEGHMCYPVEWFKEDLPLENKAGDGLDRILEGWYNEDIQVPRTLEALVKPSSAQPARFPDPPLPPRESVLVFADSRGCTKRILAAAPEGRVGTKKIVERQVWESMTESELHSLIDGQAGKWDMVVFGASLEPPPSSHVQNVIDHQSIVTHLYLILIRAIEKTEKVKRVAILTAGAFSDSPVDHKQYGLGMITSSILFGMTNSVRIELEETTLHFVDAEPSLATTPENDKYKLFPRLATELFRLQTFGHDTVRILNKGRFVLRQLASTAYEKAECDFIVPKEGIIAITGGNGALGLVMGEWLMKKCKEQGVGKGLAIQFLSRSAKIADTNLPRWDLIQEQAAILGVDVVQAKGDFSSQEAVDRYMQSIGPNLAGIIHSAGVLADSMIANLTWEKCETVFDPKHRAALYWHSALERFQNKLSFFWMFSSIAVWGAMGQTNYSGSNAFLNALCQHRVAMGKPATAIQWGAWGEVGMASTMTDSMRARMAASPAPYFSNAEGIRGLEMGLRTGLPVFSVFKWNPSVMAAAVSVGIPGRAKDHYARNFTSEIFPPPLVDSLEREHMLTALRAAFGLQHSKISGIERLHYDHFTRPSMGRYEEEWGEDFRKWAPLKA